MKADTPYYLYRYTSLISVASWNTGVGGGGAMFYKIISCLVDYIRKMTFLPLDLKNRQYTDK